MCYLRCFRNFFCGNRLKPLAGLDDFKNRHHCFCLHVVETLILVIHLTFILGASCIALTAGVGVYNTHLIVNMATGIVEILTPVLIIVSMCVPQVQIAIATLCFVLLESILASFSAFSCISATINAKTPPASVRAVVTGKPVTMTTTSKVATTAEKLDRYLTPVAAALAIVIVLLHIYTAITLVRYMVYLREREAMMMVNLDKTAVATPMSSLYNPTTGLVVPGQQSPHGHAHGAKVPPQQQQQSVAPSMSPSMANASSASKISAGPSGSGSRRDGGPASQARSAAPPRARHHKGR